MFMTLIESLKVWSTTTDTRQKLQHTYVTSALVLILGAGIVGLINYDLGQKILLAAFICVAIFIANAVTWALLQSFVLLRLTEQRQLKPGSKPVTKK